MVLEAEDRGAPVVGAVGADPLEGRGAVVEGVRQDVDFRVVPGDEPAVHPDVLKLFDHKVILGQGGSQVHGKMTNDG